MGPVAKWRDLLSITEQTKSPIAQILRMDVTAHVGLDVHAVPL
jgi:RNA polymerase subunit RPABC4/transcription elongation factor Spt4